MVGGAPHVNFQGGCRRKTGPLLGVRMSHQTVGKIGVIIQYSDSHDQLFDWELMFTPYRLNVVGEEGKKYSRNSDCEKKAPQRHQWSLQRF